MRSVTKKKNDLDVAVIEYVPEPFEQDIAATDYILKNLEGSVARSGEKVANVPTFGTSLATRGDCERPSLNQLTQHIL